MLREIKHTNDNSRWFNSPEHDLYIYFNQQNKITCIEFCYQKTRNEKVIKFHHQNPPKHMRVDDGESGTSVKMSPIYVANGSYQLPEIINHLQQTLAHLPLSTQDLILNFVHQNSKALM